MKPATLKLWLFAISSWLLAGHAQAVGIIQTQVFDNIYLISGGFLTPGDQVTFSASGQNFWSTNNDKTVQIFMGTNEVAELDMTGQATWTISGSFIFNGTNLSCSVNGGDNNTNDAPVFAQGYFTNGFSSVTLQIIGLSDATNNAGISMNSATVNSTELGSIPASPPGAAVVSHLAIAGLSTNTLYEPIQTITTSSNSTGGLGAGLIAWDTNYIYVSVGTNLWKRAALTDY